MILPISKLAKMKNGKWCNVPINERKTFFKINYDQLIIISDEVVLEYYKLKHFIKGFLKLNVLILIHGEEDQVQKIKVKFSTTYPEIEKFVKLLKVSFVIENYEHKNDQVNESTITSFYDLLELELSRQSSETNLQPIFPRNFNIDQFIKTCLLDPDFPKFVDRLEFIIKENK